MALSKFGAIALKNPGTEISNLALMRIRVAIVEDRPALMENLKELLTSYGQVHLVFSATNGREAIEKMKFYHDKVDVILMDIEMPEMDGIEATRIIKSRHPDISILILTVFEHRANLMQALSAGADGYLLKGEQGETLVLSLRQALEGRMPLSPPMAAKAMAELRSVGQASAAVPSLSAVGLTSREVEIYQGLVAAWTYTQIADDLCISPKTVRRHMENLYKKLGVHSKAEAIGLAHRHAWF